MRDDLAQTVLAYKLLADPKNVAILQELRKKPSKAKDLEGAIMLDRMSIKRHLYALAKAGLVREERVKSGKAIAIVYHPVNRQFPASDAFTVLSHAKG